MKTLPYSFFVAAVVFGLLGMIWGIQMSASGNHMMAPAHAHLNLLGWVSMAIYGVFYRVVRGASQGLLPKIHFALALAGVILIVPGIAMAVSGQGEALAKIGSLLTVLQMLLFLFIVITRGREITCSAE